MEGGISDEGEEVLQILMDLGNTRQAPAIICTSYDTHFQGGRSGERGRGAAQSLIGRAGLLMISLIKRKDLSLVLSMKHASKKLKDIPWSNNMFHRCFGPGVITSVYLSLTGEMFCSFRPLGLWDRPKVSGADQWSMIILKMLLIFWKYF